MSLFSKLFGVKPKKQDKEALREQLDHINARFDEIEAEIRAKGDTPENAMLLEGLRRKREKIQEHFNGKDT